MPNSLQSVPVRPLLDRLFKAADGDALNRALVAMRHPSGFATATARERADACEELYLPVSPEGGRLLYALIRACRPATVAEFGTSFGISTIHLAAAVRDNGAGRVITTELSAVKVAQATANIAEAGFADLVTILAGDAGETLATLDAPVQFVLLDGWANLYLSILRRLEPRLTPGALIVANGTMSQADEMADYLSYVRDSAHGYLSIPFPEAAGLEVTCCV
jgi:predicted O-methyltransferase YrrM